MTHHSPDTFNILNVAVITVSDTRSLDEDTSGAMADELCTAAGHTVQRSLVRDDAAAIRAAVELAALNGSDVIVLTGGTGVAPRDVTYEAVAVMLEKTLDGFGEAFRRLSWDEIGARSVLSRAIAGTRGRTMIVALPGSTKAVRLGVSEVLLPIVTHVIGLLRT
jgi:molybdopterin adenylyltransferase